MKTIYRYIRPYGGVLILTLLLKLAAALLDLLIPSFLARIIDDAVPSGDRMAIFRMGGVMVLCAVLSMRTDVTANRMAKPPARCGTICSRSCPCCPPSNWTMFPFPLPYRA